MQTFKDFMESALYDPESGFYSRRTLKQDFYTAPELHPAFAGVLAREIAARLEKLQAAGVPGPYSIVEMGSGSGQLARQILGELRRQCPAWSGRVRYALIERSASLLLESVSTLSRDFERVAGFTSLAEVEPKAGVFLSNELVDAFPVHLLQRQDGLLREVYVDGGRAAALGPISDPRLKKAAERVELEEGGRHAVNLAALDWVDQVSARLKAGFLITIDYGSRLPKTAPNPPRSYRRHAVSRGDEVLAGDRDITANVDFETVIEQGARCGLRVDSYGTLSSFLLAGGVSDWLPEGWDVEAIAQRNRIKTLIHPEGMGESFKVLIQSKGIPS